MVKVVNTAVASTSFLTTFFSNIQIATVRGVLPAEITKYPL